MNFETEKYLLDNIKKLQPLQPTEKIVVELYLRQRLRPVQEKYYKTKDGKLDFNCICDIMLHHYLTKHYSIDAMVNATFHFCNINGHPPTKTMFNIDIEMLLEDYADE